MYYLSIIIHKTNNIIRLIYSMKCDDDTSLIPNLATVIITMIGFRRQCCMRLALGFNPNNNTNNYLRKYDADNMVKYHEKSLVSLLGSRARTAIERADKLSITDHAKLISNRIGTICLLLLLLLLLNMK